MDICVAYVHKLGYVYQGYVYKNINRKLVCLYLIMGVLKLNSLRSNCSKYGFVSVINDLTGLLVKAIFGHCAFNRKPRLKQVTFYSVLDTLYQSWI